MSSIVLPQGGASGHSSHRPSPVEAVRPSRRVPAPCAPDSRARGRPGDSADARHDAGGTTRRSSHTHALKNAHVRILARRLASILAPAWPGTPSALQALPLAGAGGARRGRVCGGFCGGFTVISMFSLAKRSHRKNLESTKTLHSFGKTLHTAPPRNAPIHVSGASSDARRSLDHLAAEHRARQTFTVARVKWWIIRRVGFLLYSAGSQLCLYL